MSEQEWSLQITHALREYGFGSEDELDRKVALEAAEIIESLLLAQQAREIAELTAALKETCKNWSDSSKQKNEEISKLTARAERAERERDALISSIERLRTKKIELCSICEFEDLIACCHKNHCEGYQLFKRRGLPQEGGDV